MQFFLKRFFSGKPRAASPREGSAGRVHYGAARTCLMLLAALFVSATSPLPMPAADAPQASPATEAQGTEQPISTAPRSAADETLNLDVNRIFAGEVPRSLDELRAMQVRQQELAREAQSYTVSVRVGNAQGSGVIISKDGYVLTAAHVAGKPGRTAQFILADGKKVEGKSLGTDRTLDAGLMKINEIIRDGQPVRWEYARLGNSKQLKPGQWCLATGHPYGYFSDRPPVVRVGRILANRDSVLITDCKLVGGDSGGPLFDMDGKVIGIHSRIGAALTLNMHVPIDTFMEDWDRLVSGEDWGNLPGMRPGIGVEGEAGATRAKIARVLPGRAAEKAGLKAGDVVLRFDGKPVEDFSQLQDLVQASRVGATVKVVVERDGKPLELDLVVENLGGRSRRR